MNEIIIELESKYKVLAGNPFGRDIYNKFFDGKFDINKKNTIIFPECVKIICSSFVQGLFSKVLESHSTEEIINSLNISDEKIFNYIKQGLTD